MDKRIGKRLGGISFRDQVCIQSGLFEGRCRARPDAGDLQVRKAPDVHSPAAGLLQKDPDSVGAGKDKPVVLLQFLFFRDLLCLRDDFHTGELYRIDAVLPEGFRHFTREGTRADDEGGWGSCTWHLWGARYLWGRLFSSANHLWGSLFCLLFQVHGGCLADHDYGRRLHFLCYIFEVRECSIHPLFIRHVGAREHARRRLRIHPGFHETFRDLPGFAVSHQENQCPLDPCQSIERFRCFAVSVSRHYSKRRSKPSMCYRDPEVLGRGNAGADAGNHLIGNAGFLQG